MTVEGNRGRRLELFPVKSGKYANDIVRASRRLYNPGTEDGVSAAFCLSWLGLKDF